MHKILASLLVVAPGLTTPLYAQDVETSSAESTALAPVADSCYSLEVASGEWQATLSDPEPTHPFSPDFFVNQIPARFVVTDSVLRRGGRAARSLADPRSQYRISWLQESERLLMTWGHTGFSGWVGEFERTSDDSAATWTGLVQYSTDNQLGPQQARGQWAYRVEISSIECTDAQAGVS